MEKIYSYGKQNITKSDIKCVEEVLKSDWLTQGPKITEFEKHLGKKFGANYVTVVSSGTAALHLSGLALGWKPDDIIITSPITFLASANCILYSNAIPDFIDINEITYTIDVNKLEDKIRCYRKRNKNIKAVIAVDFAGQPCDWKNLRYLADKYEFQLVNDNCHALGAKYFNDEKYAVKYADVVCQSYHPVKHITTGEGGSILTNNKNIDEKVKILRSHGTVKSFKEKKNSNIKEKYKIGSWYYEMQYLGYNYRITDIQCALGMSQLKKLNENVIKRRKIAKFYDGFFSHDERFIVPVEDKNSKHSYHLYPLQINFDKIKRDKIDIFEELKNNRINCQVHYIPIHLQPYYRKNFGFKKGDFPNAESFYKKEISIPLYPLLNKTDLKYISNKISEITK